MDISYPELVTILLTGVAAIVAALGVTVALVGIVGYRDIKNAAVSAAVKAMDDTVAQKAEKYLEALSDESSEFRLDVRKWIAEEISNQRFGEGEGNKKWGNLNSEYGDDESEA